jgi:hypothetical protein
VAWSPDDSQLLMNRSWPDGPEQIVVIDMTTEFPHSETILAQSRKPLEASDWCSVAPGP